MRLRAPLSSDFPLEAHLHLACVQPAEEEELPGMPVYLRLRPLTEEEAAADGEALRSVQPSLFLAAERAHSGLHADDRATRFWMGVLAGSKTFRLVNASAAHHFQPTGLHRRRAYELTYASNAFDDATLREEARAAVVVLTVASLLKREVLPTLLLDTPDQ